MCAPRPAAIDGRGHQPTSEIGMTRPHRRNRPDRWQPAVARECDRDREATAADGPVAEFARLVAALDARDFHAVTVARKAHRRHGWACTPCGKRGG